MKYLVIFVNHGDDTATWSDYVEDFDKKSLTQMLVKNGASLDNAEILIVESKNNVPQVVEHWSALNGDFDGM